MQIGVLILAAFLSVIVPFAANAQTSTADGVDALVRGEYQRAAEILKPIAERSWGVGDDVATFFMATLYENGLGVQRDPVRACALYLRASLQMSPSPGPFPAQAQALGQVLQPSMSQAQNAECLLLTQLGFEHGFQPAIFQLEQRHSIRLDLSTETLRVEATITYEGKEKRATVEAAWVPSGVRFLPIEHTELTTGRPEPALHRILRVDAGPGPAVVADVVRRRGGPG